MGEAFGLSSAQVASANLSGAETRCTPHKRVPAPNTDASPVQRFSPVSLFGVAPKGYPP